MIGQAKRLYELNTLESKMISGNKGSSIIAFLSGKGGTGKSFLSTNLAFALSQKGKRVLLIDLDLNFANINLILNVNTSKNIFHLLNREADIDELIFHYSNNYDVIFGANGKFNHPGLSQTNSDFLYGQITQILSNYDFVFLDMSSGIGENVINMTKFADYIFIISTPQPTSVMDAYVVCKILKKSEITNDKFLIVNKSNSNEHAQLAHQNLSKAIEHFLNEKIKFLGIVGHENSVDDSIFNQELLTEHSPNNIISLQIKGIADKIVKFKQVANNIQ